jgi:hypothetical protein
LLKGFNYGLWCSWRDIMRKDLSDWWLR